MTKKETFNPHDVPYQGCAGCSFRLPSKTAGISCKFRNECRYGLAGVLGESWWAPTPACVLAWREAHGLVKKPGPEQAKWKAPVTGRMPTTGPNQANRLKTSDGRPVHPDACAKDPTGRCRSCYWAPWHGHCYMGCEDFSGYEARAPREVNRFPDAEWFAETIQDVEVEYALGEGGGWWRCTAWVNGRQAAHSANRTTRQEALWCTRGKLIQRFSDGKIEGATKAAEPGFPSTPPTDKAWTEAVLKGAVMATGDGTFHMRLRPMRDSVKFRLYGHEGSRLKITNMRIGVHRIVVDSVGNDIVDLRSDTSIFPRTMEEAKCRPGQDIVIEGRAKPATAVRIELACLQPSAAWPQAPGPSTWKTGYPQGSAFKSQPQKTLFSAEVASSPVPNRFILTVTPPWDVTIDNITLFDKNNQRLDARLHRVVVDDTRIWASMGADLPRETLPSGLNPVRVRKGQEVLILVGCAEEVATALLGGTRLDGGMEE